MAKSLVMQMLAEGVDQQAAMDAGVPD